jgi:hypothetical protein
MGHNRDTISMTRCDSIIRKLRLDTYGCNAIYEYLHIHDNDW